MNINGKKTLCSGFIFIALFTIWTFLIQVVDVQSIGLKDSDVGFATLNKWFHNLTGVNLMLYNITDWLGLVPVFICMIFATFGLVQLINRRSLLKVDLDITFLGIYYAIVIFGYLIFEMIPINYRPILINGFVEASYPSSTTLLVLSVMPSLVFQSNYRVKNNTLKQVICVFTIIFSAFMVIGRLISGVHWLTDIVGSIFLSFGLFCLYKGIVLLTVKR